ncbi:uncharacterized protein LOC129336035 [Eublepharis macularius]|uniref:1-alkyl-2-acetylglycerophosphocholine esterase n=1 Tax=Eublepharis macularius TaxID=481883 RepID=A0AA97L7D8_EUBMA|nr:uncharacterized protein LOC129336035 [Eublepharis macularius]
MAGLLSGDVQAAGEVLEVQEASGTEQAWADEGGPLALAVEPPVAESAEDTGVVSHRGRLRILICRHSMVFWAVHQAKRTQMGSQLGLSEWATVEWQGRRGLRWPGLMPLLFRERRGLPPHILVIHLGGNDLGLIKGKALSLQAQADLQQICVAWPGVLILWSAILPRRKWHEGLDARGMNEARRRANSALLKALGNGLGIYLPHPRIRAAAAHLYRDDGVHLSEAGNELFLEDLRQGLRMAISHLWGARA